MDPNQIVLWPDLSPYGISLGIVRAENKPMLVFADEGNHYGHIARNMGFSKTRWDGLWVRDNLSVVPGMFSSVFPRVAITRRTHTEISQEVMAVVRRKTAEASAKQASAQTQAPAPAAAKAAKAPKAAKPKKADTVTPVGVPATDGIETDLSPLIAEARPLGINMLGESVFQAPNGDRFIKHDTDEGVRVLRENTLSDGFEGGPARFLRAPNDVSMELCAEGFVRAMNEGHIARADDFNRFFHAVVGPDAAPGDADIIRVAAEIDRVRARKLASISRKPTLAAFEHAITLHERCQYYSLVNAGRMTPLPVGVVMQRICATQAEDSVFRVISEDRGEHSSLLANLFAQAEDGKAPNILLGSFSVGNLPQQVNIDGIEVSRQDHKALLDAVKALPDDGLGVFMINGDGEPGRIGAGSRRFLDHIATHYAIEGIVDIDGALTGAPGEDPRRLVVIGKRREQPGHAGLPPHIPHVVDMDALWGWGSKVAQQVSRPGSVPISEVGGVASEFSAEQNVWQAPYIPSSLLSEPALMIPRNLAAPTRRAMLKVTGNNRLKIDDFLCDELGYTPEELRSALDAEQADAVALGIYRVKTGLGFMEADQTGIGKGRVLAALARWARRQGIPVVFCTERAELFSDFYRDIEDIGAQDYFKNIFVMNDGPEAPVKSMQTGEIIARPAPRAELLSAMRKQAMPEGADVVFCTYSQFNRDPNAEIERMLRKKHPNAADMTKAREALANDPRLSEIQAERRSAKRKFDMKTAQVIKYDGDIEKAAVSELVPMSALKSMWIGKAVTDALVIMDESHVAAGEESQTNTNFMHAVMNAKYVVGSSATFARGERNMRIYRRNFPKSVDVEALHETLKKGGEPLQETLSSMLAEDGGLIRREHDLSMIEFVSDVDAERLQFNRDVADKFAEVLSAMAYFNRQTREFTDSLSEELKKKLTAAGDHAAAETAGVTFNSGMGSRMYLLVKQFLTILKVERAVDLASKALKEGRKPVIVISHTMEATLRQALEAAMERQEVTETDDGKIIPTPSFGDCLLRTLEKMMNVTLEGDDVDIKKSPEVAAAIRAVEDKIRDFPFMPISPMDKIYEALSEAGYSGAEISGRKSRIIDLGNGQSIIKTIPASERKTAKDRFNNGAADFVFLSPAGNSGISLHSSPRFLDQNQRELIELEVPEDVIVRTQFFGRVNRKGQICPPVVTTTSSGLPAENRVIAMQNQKLRKLSANITSNRDNAAITANVPDILNSIGNEVCFRFLERSPALAEKLDITMPEIYEKEAPGFTIGMTTYVDRLMGRLVMLPVVQQEQVIEELTSEFNALIAELDAKGENPLKARFYDIKATKGETELLEAQVHIDDEDDEALVSAFDRAVTTSSIDYEIFQDPKPAAEVKADIAMGLARMREDLLFKHNIKMKPSSPLGDFANLISVGKQKLLEYAKSAKFSTVEAALTDANPNVVKTLDYKLNRLLATLPDLKPGTVIEYTDIEKEIQTGVVTYISPPNTNLWHLPGQYELFFCVPGSRQSKISTLHALFQDENFKVLGAAGPEHFQKFDETRGGSFKVSRQILDGNLFRASEMAIQRGIGTSAIYTDEVGQAQRAIVLPLRISMMEFNRLPLRILDVGLVTQYFTENDNVALCSMSEPKKNIKGDGKGIRIRRYGSDLHVNLPGTANWVQWLKSHPSLLQVTGSFIGDRNGVKATVPLMDAGPFFEELYKTGTTLYADTGAPREWFSLRLNIKPQKKRGKNVDAAGIHDPLAEADGEGKRSRKKLAA